METHNENAEQPDKEKSGVYTVLVELTRFGGDQQLGLTRSLKIKLSSEAQTKLAAGKIEEIISEIWLD